MNKRKILLLAALLVMVAILGVGGTLAYFTAEDEATNTFTVGNVKIELNEPNWEEAEDVYPGQVLPKDPKVTNVGTNPCYVRIAVEGLDVLGKDDLLIKVGELGTDWVHHTDGYYYYTEVLEKDAATTAVFETITIPTALTNEEGTEHPNPYDIDVKAYAVQAQGAPDGTDTVAEIAAWFEICMPKTTEDTEK